MTKPFGLAQPEPDPRKVIRELVQSSVQIKTEMAAPALALHLIQTGDPYVIAAFARELTLECLIRMIRAERTAAAAPPETEQELETDHGVRQPRQMFLPEYVEQLKQLPEIIPNRAGEPIKTLKAKYADLREHLGSLNRQYWAKRANDPEIMATRALLHAMHPQWKVNPEVTLEEALVLESAAADSTR